MQTFTISQNSLVSPINDLQKCTFLLFGSEIFRSYKYSKTFKLDAKMGVFDCF